MHIPLLRIVPDDTKFDFMRFRRISFPLSAVLSIVAMLLFFFNGLNLGVDFVGGTLIEVQSKTGPADLARMRSTMSALGLGDVQLQQFGAPTDVLIRIPQQPGGEGAQQEAVAKVRGALGSDIEYRRVEVVGPRVSTELLAYGTVGLMMAILCILVYLWFRFEWQFALGAMIANVHDLVLTIGFMSLTQIDFDLTSIAALADHSRIFAQRHRRDLRPHPRDAQALQENADGRSSQHFGQFDAVALDHHPLDGDARLARAVLLRRARDPQLHRDHDFRRGAGRHLHVGLHRGADPDLSRRRHSARLEAEKARKVESRTRFQQAEAGRRR